MTATRPAYATKAQLEQAAVAAAATLTETTARLARARMLAAVPVARLTPEDRSSRVFRAAAATPQLSRFGLIRVASRVARLTHRPMTSTTENANSALTLLAQGRAGSGCATWGERDSSLDSLATGVTFGPSSTMGRI